MVPYFSPHHSSQAEIIMKIGEFVLLKVYYTEVAVTVFMCGDNVCLLRHVCEKG